jgi:chromosome partitioning protein
MRQVIRRGENVIIVAGGIKGGSGKTTVATNLAVIRAAQGHEVVLIDADDQETSYDFTQLRAERMNGNPGYLCTKQSGMGVRTASVQFAEKYDTVIIDTGGRDTASQRAALSVAHLLLVPFVPRSFDVWTVERVIRLISEVKPINPSLQAIAFLNRTDPRGQFPVLSAEALKEANSALLEFSGLMIGNRIAFGTAAAEGRAITEVKPCDAKATDEMLALSRYAFDIRKLSETCAFDMKAEGMADGR